MVTATVDFTSKTRDIVSDAVSSCISTYGSNLVSNHTQAASLLALRAGGYRIPLQWAGGNPHSSAGGGPQSPSGDQFISAIQALGANAHIVIGGSADNNFSAQDAANMVRHYSPKGVKHYIVGNEPNNGGMSMQAYCQLFNACSQAMKLVDPSISVAGPAWAYYDADQLQQFINSCKGHFDAVDYHHYAMGNQPAMSTDAALAATSDWGKEVSSIYKMLSDAGLPNVVVQVGEYNWAWQYNDGQSGGDHRFYQAPITAWAASLIGHVLSAGGRCFQYSDQNGPLGITVEPGNNDQGKPGNTPQPIYWGLAAWTGGAGLGKALYKASTDSPAVEVYATDTKVILINKTGSDQTVNVMTKGGASFGKLHTTGGDPYASPAALPDGVAFQTIKPYQVVIADVQAVKPVPDPVPTPDPTPTPTPVPATGVITAGTVIGVGAPPTWASLVQRLLVKAGYTNQQVNGGYGTTTTANVKDFQAKHGLPVTGNVDEATLDKLVG